MIGVVNPLTTSSGYLLKNQFLKLEWLSTAEIPRILPNLTSKIGMETEEMCNSTGKK